MPSRVHERESARPLAAATNLALFATPLQVPALTLSVREPALAEGSEDCGTSIAVVELRKRATRYDGPPPSVGGPHVDTEAASVRVPEITRCEMRRSMLGLLTTSLLILGCSSEEPPKTPADVPGGTTDDTPSADVEDATKIPEKDPNKAGVVIGPKIMELCGDIPNANFAFDSSSLSK